MSLAQEIIQKHLIPLDKSWMIRMGILDLIHDSPQCLNFLEQEKNLGTDLQALKNVLKNWKTSDTIEVGESGTLYRFLQFLSWKHNLNKKFVRSGTLSSRKIESNPEIVNLPLAELLQLDNGTSQWASAAVLLGSKEHVPNPPYKLALTYTAVEHWNISKKDNHSWLPKYDSTILAQALTYIELKKEKRTLWSTEQAEDYCFARAFNLISREQGLALWPSLQGHESNRIEEMKLCLQQAEKGQPIQSRDHRVVQALAMLYKNLNKPIQFIHPECVAKSWPQFWDFLKEY
ncbi:MAG: hypothetical protein WCK90_01140 [archaeon]